MPFAKATSGNAAGRPPVSLALADVIRRRFPPEVIADHLEALLASEDDRVRMAAVQFASDRGYGKVLTTVEMTQRAPEAAVDWSAVSPEKRVELLAAADEIEAIAVPVDSDEPVAH